MKKYIIPVILTILLIGTAIALTGEETMTRTGPSTVQPGTSFQVTYTAVGATPPWFISLEDSVSGGCQFPAGDTLRTVMLSDEGNTKQITITAPSSEGTCIFHGDYMYGDFPALNFADLTVSVSGDAPPCTDTCSSLGFECGSHLICGVTEDCGICSTGEVCVNGVCELGTCTDTCASLGYECGTHTICGQSTNCGTCPTGETCVGGICETGEPPTFDWNMVLFTIGTFEVTLLIVLIVGGAILLLLLLKK